MRVIHYAGSGCSGMKFPCWLREMSAHLDSAKPGPDAWGKISDNHKVYPVPPPRVHTSLDSVTCMECWRSIKAMADRAVKTGVVSK